MTRECLPTTGTCESLRSLLADFDRVCATMTFNDVEPDVILEDLAK
jgi:hypothetical protein